MQKPQAIAKHTQEPTYAGHKAVVIAIDIDKAPDLANAYQVEVVPTLLVFHDGEPKGRATGFHSEAALSVLLAVFNAW